MKKTNLLHFTSAALAVLLLGTTAFLAACESESVDDAVITVSPSTTKLGQYKSVTLTASGGWNYSWSLGTSGIGNLSATRGKSVVYTAISTGATQIVTVTGMNGVTSGTNSTTTTSSFSATAVIIQQ